ncbi:outer membrane beta-barrel protein [Algicola sagamiensis]|uniref:outer membrane beta-barrel protein n=1 Tax=Algicola sagamiensis TaxID=163869 RepID=UPI000362F0EC|nr:outer membrane beta-barrel protein [Algicola sagamiensis]
MKKIILCAALLAAPAVQAESVQENGQFYIGAGLGFTKVNPEGESNGWHTVDKKDTGWNIKLGYDIAPQWFAELSYTDAGAATLDNHNPKIEGSPELSYQIPAVMGGYWLFENWRDWNVYLKLGLSSIQNDISESRVQFNKDSSIQLAGGIGAQWYFSEKYFLRLEIDTYDKDANYAGLMIGGYFGD